MSTPADLLQRRSNKTRVIDLIAPTSSMPITVVGRALRGMYIMGTPVYWC